MKKIIVVVVVILILFFVFVHFFFPSPATVFYTTSLHSNASSMGRYLDKNPIGTDGGPLLITVIHSAREDGFLF